MNTRHCVIDSRLGELTVVAEEGALTGVYFRHHWHRPDPSTFGARVDAHSDALFAEAAVQLTGYLAGDRVEFDLPVGPHGDHRQHRVWNLAGYAGGLERKQLLLELEEPADVQAARLF